MKISEKSAELERSSSKCATRRLVYCMVGLVIASSALTGPAIAAQRALIIGNSQYARAPDLPNPVNDARDIALRLEELGFEIAGGGPGVDLTREELASAIRAFTNSLEDGDLALFYYAGHGAQSLGENFIIPSNDDDIEFVSDLNDYAYAASSLLRRLEGRPGVTSVVIFDACRNNPLGVRTRDAGGGVGLAHMDAPQASPTFIMFAAAKGRTASDGEGRNSRFTSAFLRALERPARRLEDIAYEVRRQVRLDSDGGQIPWVNSSLEAPIFLAEGATTGTDAPAAPTVEDGILADGESTYGVISLSAGFEPDPHRVSLLAGGPEDASQLDPDCRGYIAREPDYLLEYVAEDYPLHISASSGGDTVIAVRDPNGVWWCNDDFSEVNPAVSFTDPRSGTYRIWVGVYSPDEGYPGAELIVSEIEPTF